MTPEEAKKVLAAADDAAANEQWRDVVHLLDQVHASHVLTGHDQGDAAYLLGVARVHLGEWETAAGLLTEASELARSDNRADARDKLAEIKHHYRATDAEADGVSKKEGRSVLTAADEALTRGDTEEAYTHYWAVFDGHTSASDHAKAAIGLAQIWAARREFSQAEQYAKYVIDANVSASLTEQANTLISWMTEQRAAATAMADGTTPDEFAATSAAADSAFQVQDYALALPLFASIAAADQLGSDHRSRAAYNAGLCSRFLGSDTDARHYFEFSAEHGDSGLAQDSRERIAEIDRHTAAEEIVAHLAK